MGNGKRVSNSGPKGGNYGKYDKKSMTAMNKSQEAVKSASREHQRLLDQPRRRSSSSGTQARAQADPTETKPPPSEPEPKPQQSEPEPKLQQSEWAQFNPLTVALSDISHLSLWIKLLLNVRHVIVIGTPSLL